jgi:hypothetical protein
MLEYSRFLSIAMRFLNSPVAKGAKLDGVRVHREREHPAKRD